ncbi:ankyrin repeat domain-containing protein [Salinibacter grassmerensis]|uniref:ankyrin repeat domain-containing protein n=1 Tax=Salinibacter grassmerensis TaxID=3040353 RepID=UPI003C6E3F2D
MRTQTPNLIDQMALRPAVRSHATQRDLEKSKSWASASREDRARAGKGAVSGGLDFHENTPEMSSEEKRRRIPNTGKMRESELEVNPSSLLATSRGSTASCDSVSSCNSQSASSSQISGGSDEKSGSQESEETGLDYNYDDLLGAPDLSSSPAGSSPSDSSSSDFPSGNSSPNSSSPDSSPVSSSSGNLASPGATSLPGLPYVVRAGYTGLVKRCIDCGADVNGCDQKSRTPLHRCAEEGQVPVAELLIDEGARLDVRDKWGKAPLHRAASCNSSSRGAEIVELLLRSGARVEARDRLGRTPLHEASRTGNERSALRLIEAGSSVEETDAAGRAPLHLAASFGHDPAALQTLVRKGASFEKRDAMEETPLHKAARSTHVPKITSLLSAGAAANAKSAAGDTPLDLAASSEGPNRNARMILRHFGARRSSELSDAVVSPSGELKER